MKLEEVAEYIIQTRISDPNFMEVGYRNSSTLDVMIAGEVLNLYRSELARKCNLSGVKLYDFFEQYDIIEPYIVGYDWDDLQFAYDREDEFEWE